ncbi:2-octaprenyl-6-methoxyphenyl hydroxylase [Lelliottia amnigena]|uniref:2-octaprenyl-6-methoxyphenyl hydroxylase n=1 Tax=Lelliottia amnigena TaxID=61646 RepID=UPI0015773114|nr:2-octaprenyl-6-methoxyphenyl hydroxylase [Lelliottia amnigena]MBL5930622.1 2-octaprenyl-6-methoxyphenyl hydroxylase [Lelliottia amnigena]MBL5965469.1 2-octaprenyl-6-methoxyphenyl hydroxylase [Lelliottia amnigena]MBM7354524.1 2-octaprenyl-6-methoxyphenol hydroxylase [Lelliottia amnigena]NTX70065.1 2-octaprenyl-6-methoxyphenyl hydroxylase [Lelliottia amnigena]WSO20913.1 2-octaprenyl-6-methoxyphenyl hydroxylase [Lelliottia amnigena]
MSVIIVGGGMTGATLALAISKLTEGQLPVHLVEAVAPQVSEHPGFDARAIALAQGTCQQLARVGIWQAIADRTTAINTVHVSDRGHAGFVTLDAQDYRIDALGHVVELHDVGLRLFRLLQDAPGVTLHCPARVASFTRSQDSVSVTLDNGDTLEGQLLVAADGSRSALATQCGVEWHQQPYGQAAVIANVSTAVAHQGRAFERFTEFGPLAMLPMSDGRSSLVWCHALDRIDEVMTWSDARFCDELQKAFGWRLGRITHAGQRSAYPLALTTASQSISHRVALVGNAAQTLHPIAGQGFNLGLRDVMSLAETLAQAWRDHNDYGAYAILSHYQKRRQTDKEATIGVTDGLVHLFANRWAPLVAGRNAGLMAMELFIPARNVLAQRTLGWVAR